VPGAGRAGWLPVGRDQCQDQARTTVIPSVTIDPVARGGDSLLS
jgi:hypothetical protein